MVKNVLPLAFLRCLHTFIILDVLRCFGAHVSAEIPSWVTELMSLFFFIRKYFINPRVKFLVSSR